MGANIDDPEQLELTLEDALDRVRKLAAQYETERVLMRDTAARAGGNNGYDRLRARPPRKRRHRA